MVMGIVEIIKYLHTNRLLPNAHIATVVARLAAPRAPRRCGLSRFSPPPHNLVAPRSPRNSAKRGRDFPILFNLD